MVLFRVLAGLVALLSCALAGISPACAQTAMPDRPLRVLLIPADGGTEDGTRADFLPLFNAISASTGLRFEVMTGHSYAAVIEGMCSGLADIAWFGAASYIEARERGCAELLAVEVTGGESQYYAGLFVRSDAAIDDIEALRGRSLAVGSVHSTSSFIYPVSMLLDVGLDPVRDLAAIRITDSHANALRAVQAGAVDAAAASFDSYARAVTRGALGEGELRVLARSAPIPNPPLALNPALPDAVKAALRDALARVHEAPGVTPDMVRGYGGKRVDRYDVTVTDALIDEAAGRMARVGGRVTDEIVAAAGRSR